MAQISQQHTAPLASGFVSITIFALIVIAVLNHFADK